MFKAVAFFNECTIMQHAANLGKGRALKTAFNHFLNNYGGFIGLITVDADGQHKCEDIIRIAQSLQMYPDSLIIGTEGLYFIQKNIRGIRWLDTIY